MIGLHGAVPLASTMLVKFCAFTGLLGVLLHHHAAIDDSRVICVQVSWALVKALPLPQGIRGDQAGLFIINIVLGLVCIFFK